MADTATGVLSAAQINSYFDPIASIFKGVFGNDGIGASTETLTKTALSKNARALILGGRSVDGLTTYPGVGNADLQASVKDDLDRLVARSRYDTFFNGARGIVSAIQGQIGAWIPPGWVFSSQTQLQVLDSYLLYLNAMHISTPTTPAAAGTLAAATTVGGGLGTFVAGSCPFVVHCIVSAAGDWFVSLPSAEATQVATTGSQNSLTYQVAGNAPVGSAYLLVFRTRTGALTGGPYFLDQRVPISAGSPYPLVKLTQPDSLLRTDWTPPVWGSALQMPETAAFFALAFAASGSSTINPLQFSSTGMLSVNNVVLEVSNGFLGEGNPASTGIFGIRIVGTGFTAGTVATTNNAPTNTQGFVGAGGAANVVQARVTSALNAAGTTSITYSYYAAATGYGVTQSVASAAATFSGTAVGSTATYVIPAGRIVFAVTAETPTGMTSGTYLIEGLAPRTY